MPTIHINREPVELYKILKFEGLVGTGGEAKVVIDQGMVKVNGEPELQRRKKIRHGDVIEFMECAYQIVYEP
ncbi:RNA-binding S4 domain-containing protein [Marinicella meishanensis]|uniref:RNA-binding S4 domain-containing protein n=1 Tax=Marinicella meishanensis TaxID=2873263 RepID=UPI001CC0882D|nr:RNA-binding S4 domain-containing protein [Marinicella sp. NBU2979]